MEKIKLNSAIREASGTGGAKQLRNDGKVPAVVYKSGKVGLNICADKKELWNALHTDAGENALITLDITGGTKPAKKTVIVQEIQLDPLSDEILHVDFHEISLKEKIKVKVPVQIKGEAEGVKEGGVLNQVLWDMEVECLPTDIPEHIIIKVNDLKVNDAIHVKEVNVPEGSKFLDDAENVVVAVVPPQAEEPEEVEEAVEEVEAGSEPEVIKKGKPDDEESAEKEAE